VVDKLEEEVKEQQPRGMAHYGRRKTKSGGSKRVQRSPDDLVSVPSGGGGPKTQRRRIKTKTKSKNTRKLYRRRDRIVTGTPQEKTKMKTKNKIKNKSKNKTKNKTKNKLRIKAKNKQNKNSINKIFK